MEFSWNDSGTKLSVPYHPYTTPLETPFLIKEKALFKKVLPKLSASDEAYIAKNKIFPSANWHRRNNSLHWTKFAVTKFAVIGMHPDAEFIVKFQRSPFDKSTAPLMTEAPHYTTIEYLDALERAKENYKDYLLYQKLLKRVARHKRDILDAKVHAKVYRDPFNE